MGFCSLTGAIAGRGVASFTIAPLIACAGRGFVAKTWAWKYADPESCRIDLGPEGLRIADREKNCVDIPFDEIPELVKGVVSLLSTYHTIVKRLQR